MAINRLSNTISKNGKRVPASEKGKETRKATTKKKAPRGNKPEARQKPNATVEYNGQKADLDDKHAARAVVDEVVRDVLGTSKRAKPQVNTVTGEVLTPPSTPLVRITCPTAIGKVTSTEASRYSIDAVAIVPDHTSGDHVFLTATDGRMLAIVRADYERAGNVEGAGLDAQWLPRGLAGPGAALRLAKGQTQTLFGEGLHWVDDEAGIFMEQPGGGAFPPIADLLPTDVQGTVCVRLNTKLLATLAKALNDGQNDIPEGVTLFIRQANPGEMVSRPVIAMGNRGLGLLMPAGGGTGEGSSAEAAEKWYAAFRRAFLTGRPKPKPTENVEEVLNPTPMDMAQQMPSNAEPEQDEAEDDGKDAPSDLLAAGSVDLLVGVCGILPATITTLKEAGFETIGELRKHFADYGNSMGIRDLTPSEMKSLHDAAASAS